MSDSAVDRFGPVSRRAMKAARAEYTRDRLYLEAGPTWKMEMRLRGGKRIADIVERKEAQISVAAAMGHNHPPADMLLENHVRSLDPVVQEYSTKATTNVRRGLIAGAMVGTALGLMLVAISFWMDSLALDISSSGLLAISILALGVLITAGEVK